MALPLVVDGVTFNYPEPGDRGLAQEATDWADAVTNAVATLQTNAAAELLRARVRAHISTPQTGISTATTVLFDTEDWDSPAGYVPGTGTFTVPTGYAGDYVISASVVCTQVSSTGNQFLDIKVNGTAIATDGHAAVVVGTANSVLSVSACYTLAVGDTVKIILTPSAGTITTVASAQSQFSLLKVPHA